MNALLTHATALLAKRCAVCDSGEIPVGHDDHPFIRGLVVTAPKLFACADARRIAGTETLSRSFARPGAG